MFPLWARLLASELTQQDIVAGIKLTRDKIKVRYKTGVLEVYRIKPIPFKHRPRNQHEVTEKKARIEKEIKLRESFRLGPLETDERYLEIDRKEFEQASFMEQRLVMQRLLLHMMIMNTKPTRYPDQVIDQDIETLKNTSTSNFTINGGINFFPKSIKRDGYWRRVIEHFFVIPRTYPRYYLWYAMVSQCDKHTTPISTISILKRANWMMTRQFNPTAYRAILEQLKVKNGIIDLHPTLGHKALACALMGIKYIAPMCPEIKQALDRNVCGYTGLDYEELDDQTADLLVSDNNFEGFDIGRTSEYLGRVSRMIAYAPGKARLELTSRHNPSGSIKIFCRAVAASTMKNNDYLLVW